MKNVLFTSLIILFFACSTDDSVYNDMQVSKKNETLVSIAVTKDLAFYSKLEISPRTLETGKHILVVPEKIADQIIAVMKEDYSETTKKILSETSFTDTIVMETNPVAALYVIVEESSLTLMLQQNVKSYILNLSNLQGQTDAVVDDFIIEYEITKRSDLLLAIDEKETILTISSLSEATLYTKKKRKDRDWETSTASKDIE